MAARSNETVSAAVKVEQLAAERQTLFGAAGANAGRTAAVQARLDAIEQELDACFLAVRAERAARDAERFTNEDLVLRRGIRPMRPIAKPAKS
jgi:tRNA 2-selenouridine synthase SelU